MSIEVKTISGGEATVPSNGKANLGVALGAVGTGLALLNGGLGNGILGGGNVTQQEAMVGMQKYYEDRISDLKLMNAQFNGVNEAICNLRERASVSETANAYQNRITEIGFSNVDREFDWFNRQVQFQIDAAVCDFIPAQKYLPVSHLADSFKSPTRVIDSYTAREDLPGRRCHDGWDNNCSCNGYRGF